MLVDPLVDEIGLAGRRSHDGAGAMDEQTAQALVPPLRNAHQHLAIAAGELSREGRPLAIVSVHLPWVRQRLLGFRQ